MELLTDPDIWISAIKILALAFLIMIGVALLAEGLDFHIPKGYIYFSMAFAFSVELILILALGEK